MGYTEDFLKELERLGASDKIQTVNRTPAQDAKKKKKDEEYAAEFISALENEARKSGRELTITEQGTLTLSPVQYNDIAPVLTAKKEEEDEGLLDFFQKGAFSDGYQFGDVTKSILGTVGDVGLGVVKGFGKAAEGIADLVLYGQAAWHEKRSPLPYSIRAVQLRNAAQENTIEEWTKKPTEFLDKYSLADRTTDAVAEGIGQLVPIIATGGLGAAAGIGKVGVTALTTAVTGLSGTGSGMSEAYAGGATDKEAATYGAIAGASDALTELIFGGLGKTIKATGLSTGLSSADDMLAKKVSGMFTKQIAKNFAEFGIKAGAEGFEEVLAGVSQGIGKKITYMEEEEILNILKDENLLEQFVVGAAVSGMMQAGYIPGTSEGSLREANRENRDFITGYDQNEQTVVKKETERRIAEAEKGGKKLSAKEKANIEAAVEKEMERGEISVDTIEELLGGETFSAYKKVADAEAAMRSEYSELGGKENFTLADHSRFKELESQIKESEKAGWKSELKARLDKEVSTMVQGSRLAESFNQTAQRRQAFTADVTQYDEKQRAIVQKAIDSGVLNNTRRSHELVDLVAKIGAEKGLSFDFANNAKLKESGFAVEGRTVNGFVTKDGVTLNVESSKALNSVVGHEIAHVLEGTEVYAELQKAVFEYAKSKKDFSGRRGSLTALYQNVEGANIDAELTADLIGDYLFTDEDFVRNLSTKHRNVFQKIYDEIKYLVKIATAGSKEARELERVKKLFDKAYRESGEVKADEKADTTQAEVQADVVGDVHEDSTDKSGAQRSGSVKYSLVEDQGTIDFLENQEHITVYKAMAMIDGKLYPPMASQSYVEEEYTTKSGEKKTRKVRKLKNPSVLGRWQQSDERVDIAEKTYDPKKGYSSFDLLKSNGKTTGGVAYNPYEHTSNIVLNDQFSEAYQRPELVTVEYEIPVSELTSGYKAQYAKDPVGLTDWKAGGVAQKLKHSHRDVYLTRWSKPVRVLSDAEVAQKYKEILDKEEGISVPWNVVTPSLREELEKLGVPIDYSDIKAGSTVRSFEAAMRGDYAKPKKASKAAKKGEAKYSLSGRTTPSYEDLTAEKPVHIVDVTGGIASGSYKDMKAAAKTKAEKEGWFDKPHHNEDTDSLIFLTERAFNHAFSNLRGDFGEDTIRVMAHVPEVIKEARLLNVADPKSPMKAESKVYTFIGAIKGVNGVEPVKLTVKEYASSSVSMIPQNIRAYFEKNGIADSYDTLYDAKALEVIGIEGIKKEPDASGKVNGDTPQAQATSDSDIRVADLLNLVKGDARKYVPLSAAQREYFKDSKVRDENGNLKVMYHGTPNGDFTVFRNGGYFTESKEYAERYTSPSASSISTGKAATAPKVFEVYLDIKKPFDLNDAEARSIYINEYIKGGNAMGINPYLSDAEYDAIESIDWTEGEDLKDFLIENGYDYDGLVLDEGADGGYGEAVQYRGKSYVVFSPEQVKSVDNTKPTADPDIRFSLSEEVEKTDRLVAVHNKSVRGTLRMLERNGVPFASIAIKKKGAPHEGFGEVSIVFPRSTIDPEANSWNRLYSNDAWTPTEPRTEYDVGDTYQYKKLFENMLGTDIYNALRGASYLDSDALERELGSSSGDVFEAVKRLGVVKFGYLQSIGQRPEIGTKPVTLDGFGRYKNDQLLAVFEALDGETIRSATYDDTEVLQQIADVLNEQFLQQLPNDDSVFKSFKKKPLYTADKINIVAIQDAYQRWEDAGRTVPTEADTYSLENSLRDNKALEEDEGYRRWVEGIFDGLVKDSGTPNGKDYFTPSGNRRSFKALHVPATLENIVQQMRKEKETGIGSLGSINLRGAATKTYATVEDMRKDAGKLLGTRIDDDVYDGYMDGFYERLSALKQRAAKGDSWSSRDTAEQVLLEAVRDAKTKATMNAMLRKEAQWINYDQALVDDLWQLKQDVQDMPAPYFEAKPRRVVTPDEAAAYIIPDDAPAKLFAELEKRGLLYKTYKAGDEADRLNKLNSLLEEQPDLAFSLSAEGAPRHAYGDFNIYGEDVALQTAPAEEFAPMAEPPVEDIAPTADATVPEDEMFPDDIKRTANADFAKIDLLYDDLDELDAMVETMGEQMREAIEDGDYEQATAINDTLVEIDKEYNAVKQELDAELADFAPMTEEDIAYESERLASFEDADAPPVLEAAYGEDVDALPIPDKTVDKIAKDVSSMVEVPRKQKAELKSLIQRYAAGEMSRDGLLKEISDRYGKYTEVEVLDDVKEVKAAIRRRGLNVSKYIQSDFPDYGQMMRRYFGKVRFSKQGQAVDQMYDELSDIYPGFFPPDVLSGADQLLKIFEVADMGHTAETVYSVDAGTLAEVADTIINGVSEAQQSQSQQLREREARDAFNSLMADADRYAPPTDEDIAPVAAAQPVEAPAAPKAQITETTEEVEDKTIKTVKDRLTAKLAALQTELDTDIQLREESNSAYDALIARLQAEYDGKRNKNTKAANDILRRIERARSSKASVDADYAKRISDLGAKVAKVGEELRTGESATEQGAMRRELHAGIVENIRARFADEGFDLETVLDNAKDLSTFSTVDNTPQRVMEKALGYKEGQILADMTVNKVAQNETDGIRWLNGYTDRKNGVLAQLSKKYGIKPGSKESAAAQMYAEGFYVNSNEEIIEYGDRELAMDFPDARVQANIKGLARDPAIRRIYDETLELINASRARNAYPEIQKLDNYFLHFRAMDDTFSRLGIPFNPNDIKAKDLPTDLNGVTADLKPGQPYFASAMHRRGKRTSFDLLGGLEMYLSSAKNQIYHIDDIQTLRALRNHIADTYGQAHGLEGLDAMTEEEAEARIKEVYGAHLSTFAKFLNEEANVIAGKTALIDRGLEGIIGRRGITTLDTINRQVGANMVGFNVSSSLTNLVSMVQAIAKTSKYDVLKAFTQTVSNKLGAINGKSDGFMENNPTAIRRKGAERFHRTPWQKASDAGYFLMGAVDNISTELIVRAKYNEFTRKGMSAEDAVIAADKWASRLMGDRSLGQQPQIYNSKMLGLFTKFQLEVRNQLDSQFYDTIQEAKVSTEDIENAKERNAKKAAKIASTFFQLAVLQHLFGKAFESVAGYNPAFDIIGALIKMFGWDDDEEDEDTALDNIEEGFLELMGDLPYTSTFTGGRIPISSALPIGQFVKGEDKYGNEKSRLETLGEAAPYYVLPGGYGQIKKTVQGLGMFSDDHPIAGSYTDSGNLRFPVDDTFANRAQAAIFGQWASSNAREYFDEEYAPLKENQIQELIDVDLPIADYRDYREGLKGKDTLGEKVAYIAGLDLPIDKKNILVNNIADRKDPIDLTNYGAYDDWGEFEYAHKYPEKYAFLEANNISVEQYESFDEDTKEAWSWAYQNPEKFTLSKAVADDVVVYRQYTAALNDIKADKTADGKSISGSRKTKVADYINALDADYGEKIILFKSEYPADDTYNYEIIDYLNGREDITYEDMVTILKELDFTVLADGTVQW